MSTVTIVGIITKETKYNNAYKYEIKRSDGYFEDVIRFKQKIYPHYQVKIKYNVKKDKRYRCDKIVEKVEYTTLLTEEEDIKLLLKNTKSLTDKSINAIYNKFNEDTLKVLIDEPEKITKVKPKPKPKNEQDSEQVYIPPVQYDKLQKYLETLKFFKQEKICDELGIKYNDKILNGMNTCNMDKQTIINNPYELCVIPGIPFCNIDDVASKLDKYNRYWVFRYEPLIDYIYEKANIGGNIYLTQQDFLNICTKSKIKIDKSAMIIIKTMLIKIIINDVNYYTSKKLYYIERYIEKYILAKQKNCCRNKFYFHDDGLDDEQKKAVKTIINNNVSIINGSPGTGKSHVIAKAIELLSEPSIVLGLTGSSVQNIKKTIDNDNVVCSTIHSFLYCNYENKDGGQHADVNKNDDEYDDVNKNKKKNPKNDLYKICERIKHNHEINIFIDEMSMVPMILFCNVLKKISKLDNLRLVLIGDGDQLPCIEGGNVFSDLINYSDIPKVTLKKQHRAESKQIIENAFRALNGKDIKPDNKTLYVMKEDNQKNIPKILIELTKNHNLKSNNTCFISPRKQNHMLSCNKINLILQAHYNGDSQLLTNIGDFDVKLNDKLIYKKNEPKCNLYNGSIMIAKKYDTRKITVETEDDKKTENYLRCVSDDNKDMFNIDTDKFENIELGYATTVHSAQGKGYDNVVILLHSSMSENMLYRKLLYTAITRSKKKCIIICDTESLEMCKKIVPSRVTNLFQHNESPDYLMKYIYSNADDISKISIDYVLRNYKKISRKMQYARSNANDTTIIPMDDIIHDHKNVSKKCNTIKKIFRDNMLTSNLNSICK